MTLETPRATRRTVLKGMAAGAAVCMMGESVIASAEPSAQAGRNGLPRTTPESLGIDPAGILAFVDGVDEKVGGLHSFMLLRHGQVATEAWWQPYARQYPHMLFSLSKSFTSTAVGLAVSEGRLTVDSQVISYFPKDLPAKVSDKLAAMKVRHLLSMSTGHDKDATGAATGDKDGNWAKGFLADPLDHEPGTHFVYNSAATYMLSAIVQHLTGRTVLDYLKPRLFGPLGIQGATWEKCPRGINTGGWGLSVKTEDIARFGQLYLQKGRWNGRQLVPEKWIDAATTKHIDNGTDPNSDWAQGYCYQFWRCRHDAYRGDGAFGQYCIVMPEQDAVIAITSGVGDMQAVLNVVWDHLLPAMHADPLPAAGGPELPHRLAGLSVPPPEGNATSPAAKRVSGKTYRLEANEGKIETITCTFETSRCRISTVDENGAHEMTCGSTSWVKGTAPMGPNPPGKIAARGAWASDDTYMAKLCFYETPFVQTSTFRFEGDKVTVAQKVNVGSGPTERPPLTGHLE